MMADLPEFIGKYKIESLLARGGMGAVFRAIHPTLKRRVVLKKLTIRGSAAIAERFKREARILMDFRCDNIVRVFDHFREGSSWYMVMEYVDGMSLDQLIKKQRFLSSEMAITILMEAAKALSYAHAAGVIHRDIKPANILISKKGEIKLADFGIATSEGEEDATLTREGMTLGTPCYMPPEQIENAKNVDKRADLYSLGVMLYEMVTGKKPYPTSFSAETFLLIRKGKYVKPGKINRKIHPFVEKTIKKLMKPKPERRIKSADRLIKNLERYLSGFKKEPIHECLVAMMKPSLCEEPSYRRAGKKRFWIPAIAAMVLALTSGLWYSWQAGQIHRLILPGSRGAFTVEVQLPSLSRHVSEQMAVARLFIDDGEDMPEAAISPIKLKLLEAGTDERWAVFSSKRITLAPGRYRLKIIANNTLIWESFLLEPFSSKAGADGIKIRTRIPEARPKPLKVSASARDASSGVALVCKLSVNYGKKWVDVKSMDSSALTSGEVWQFRIESEGYKSQTFSLKIAEDQDELFLTASMEAVK